MKMAIVFLSGAASGIALLLFGTWLLVEIPLWLPYQRPDPALVTRIEKLAKTTVPFPMGPAQMPFAPKEQKYLNPSKYRRWYVEGTDDQGNRVIWGEWDVGSGGPSDVQLGHYRFPPDHVGMLGGGCSQAHLVYDINSEKLRSITCNASE